MKPVNRISGTGSKWPLNLQQRENAAFDALAFATLLLERYEVGYGPKIRVLRANAFKALRSVREERLK